MISSCPHPFAWALLFLLGSTVIDSFCWQHSLQSQWSLQCATPRKLFATNPTAAVEPPLPTPPRAIIVAGLPQQYLETLDDILSITLGNPFPPVIILNEQDFRQQLTVRQLLTNSMLLSERDHMLSEKPCKLSVAVIIFSGYGRAEVTLRYVLLSSFLSY